MRILLIGGTGFVGFALTARLMAEGHVVDVIAPEPPADWALRAMGKSAQYHSIDIRDAAALGALMRDLRPDLVIHAAAATPDSAREAAGNTSEIVAINISGTANVIECAAASAAARVIALSSVAVYGRTLDDCPILSEDLPARPQNLYAITKAAAEALALRLGVVHGIPVLAPRVGVLWGPWEHRTGLRATPSPVFHMVELARRGQDIWLPFAATAPLCDIDRACDMLMALIGADWSGGVINTGADKSMDLLDFAKGVAAMFGVRAGIDAKAANVPFFAVNRPPMDLCRLETMTGQGFATGAFDAPLRRYVDWLDRLEGSDMPCPRH